MPQPWERGAHPATAAYPFFQRWYTLFLTLSFCKSSLLSHASLIPSWLTFWHPGKVCSCTLKISFLKFSLPEPLLFLMAASQGTFRISVLNRSKSTLWKSGFCWCPSLHHQVLKTLTISWSLCPRQPLNTSPTSPCPFVSRRSSGVPPLVGSLSHDKKLPSTRWQVVKRCYHSLSTVFQDNEYKQEERMAG